MPSPVGHALGGVIVGLLTGPHRRGLSPICPRPVPGLSPFGWKWRDLAWLVIAANGPDADFLWGRHGAETHSVGAALLAGVVILAFSRGRNSRLAIAVALAWGSHVFFDWLGSDDTPPIGVMALWPFTDAYYFANAYIFDSISRRYWLPGFVMHNLMAAVKEAVLLGPLVAVLAWWRQRR